MKRILRFLMLVLLVFSFMCSSIALADDPVTQGKTALTDGTTDVDKSLQDIANILVSLAFAISLIKLTQIGFQFMLGAGKKSKAKESLIPWAVGVIICTTYLFLGPWIMETLGGKNLPGPFDN